MSILAASLALGLVLSVLALGVFISFRVLNFPDITVDGSFALGGATAAAWIAAGGDPWTGTLLGTLASAVAGACTGAVHSIMVVLAQRMISGGMALASGLILGFIFSSGALGMLLTGPIAENYVFPTVLVMTTGLVLVASPLAWMLREKAPLTLNAVETST